MLQGEGVFSLIQLLQRFTACFQVVVQRLDQQ